MSTLGHPFLDAHILVVDDTMENLNLVTDLLKFAGYKHISLIKDSSLVIDAVRSFGPDLILLDLHMPKPDGYEVMEMLREGGFLNTFIPVLVFTADATPEARKRALEAGASDFLTKPGDVGEILLRVRNFLHARELHLELHRSRQTLEERVWQRTSELALARREAIEALARTAEFQDDLSGHHTLRVGELSAAIAEAMGQPAFYVEAIRLAAPLHDIGKVAVADAILYKGAELDFDEEEALRLHTVAGERILARATSPLIIMARAIAKNHHENWDGSGYPVGISGNTIPLEARIVAVADAFDTFTQGQARLSTEDAIARIQAASGVQFDPQVVAAFRKVAASSEFRLAA